MTSHTRVEEESWFITSLLNQRVVHIYDFYKQQMRNRFYSPDAYNNQKNKNYQQKGLISSVNLKVREPKTENRGKNSKFKEWEEKKIGDYRFDVSNEIGRGYSSIVYKGVNIHTQQEVAIKVIDLKECSDSTVKMQENQIKILRTLNHPNIIKCYDIYRTPSHCYIVAEYCRHGDLFCFLSKHRRIQQVAAISIMTQIISGVKYLMDKHIIHRDLKPANILKGQNGWKIADFGFAITSSKHMKSKYNVGTPLYMPLESLVDNVYSPKSDIFSVGIIFYELLSGTTPWECRQEKELVQKLQTIPYKFPQAIEVSKGIQKIISSLCAVIYEQRMEKQDFLLLNLTYASVNPEEKIILSNIYNTPAPESTKHREDKDKINKTKSVSNLVLEKRQSLSIDSKTETRNNHILVNQLHYCRFLYYFIKNIKYLRVTPKNHVKLSLVMFKHLQKLILLLGDRKNNYFKLDRWQAFRETKKYHSTHLTMKEYSSRYEKEYMNYLKDIDMQTIQLINKNFHSLTFLDTFTPNCYSQILTCVSSLMREANHNLTIQAKNVEQPISPELKTGIEALKCLFKYYKLVNLSVNNFEDFQFFQKKSNIRVQVDFTSCSNTLQCYSEIREELKFI